LFLPQIKGAAEEGSGPKIPRIHQGRQMYNWTKVTESCDDFRVSLSLMALVFCLLFAIFHFLFE
jgi:hypothetical protein